MIDAEDRVAELEEAYVADAMLSDRPYRSAPGLGAAVEELQGHPEKYDSVVVAACVAVLSRGQGVPFALLG